jgi:hypothetical protein
MGSAAAGWPVGLAHPAVTAGTEPAAAVAVPPSGGRHSRRSVNQGTIENAPFDSAVGW